MVKRYEPGSDDPYVELNMHTVKHGGWVKYEDHAALEERNAKLEAVAGAVRLMRPASLMIANPILFAALAALDDD